MSNDKTLTLKCNDASYHERPSSNTLAIIPTDTEEITISDDTQESREVVDLPLGDIRSDPNPLRTTIDEEKLDELMCSIKQSGVITPVIVRPDPGGEGHVPVTGRRRFLACQ